MGFPRSGTVDTQTISGTKDFVAGRMNTTQAANIAVGDHLKFDTVDFARGGVGDSLGTGAKAGGSVSLDVATAYSSVSGAASLGRFSLRGGKLYKLDCSPGFIIFAAAGRVGLQWFDVTGAAGVAIGAALAVDAFTTASNQSEMGSLRAFYAPGGGQNDVFLVEVQITIATSLTSFGIAASGQAQALVETY